MNRIPSFLFGQQPTPEQITDAHKAGLLGGVQAFASKQQFRATAGYAGSDSGYMDGRCKLWLNNYPEGTLPKGAAFLTGNVRKASDLTADMNQQFSLSVLHFYSERPDMEVPEFEVHMVSPDEWRRFSLDDSIYDEPVEMPLGEWRPDQAQNRTQVLPSSVVLGMLHGQPCHAGLDEAATYWPTQARTTIGNLPVNSANGQTYTVDQYLKLAALALQGSASRLAIQQIMQSTMTPPAQAQALSQLK